METRKFCFGVHPVSAAMWTRNKQILVMRQSGCTYASIGLVFSISQQRARQIVLAAIQPSRVRRQAAKESYAHA
jgi:DNA-directed RNA polymerase sigma subunit (sigma70/sigma32)